MKQKRAKPHTHVTDQGFVVTCYHNCKELLFKWQFWVGLTFGFPVEHFLWEKVWPFYLISKKLGL